MYRSHYFSPRKASLAGEDAILRGEMLEFTIVYDIDDKYDERGYVVKPKPWFPFVDPADRE